MNGKFVSDPRVSTQKQGESGLGVEAQRKAVTDYLDGGRWKLVSEHVEVESGGNDARPKLAEAMARCRAHRATLVIAKLDRLSRDAHFLLGLQKAGVKFVAADMPEANELTIGLLAVVAQHERKMISERTKVALAAAKARGTKLGGFRGRAATDADRAKASAARIAKADERALAIAAIMARIDPNGSMSLREMARAFEAEGLPTAAGGAIWTAAAVKRVKARIGAA